MHGSDVNHRNFAGFSPLHLAVRNGEQFSMEILKYLVTEGYNTDVNIPDAKGNPNSTVNSSKNLH